MERTGLFVLATLFTGSVFAQTASLRVEGRRPFDLPFDNFFTHYLLLSVFRRAEPVVRFTICFYLLILQFSHLIV